MDKQPWQQKPNSNENFASGQSAPPRGSNRELEDKAYRHLGPKAFRFYIFRHLGPAMFFLLLAIIIIVVAKVAVGNVAIMEQFGYILNDVILAIFALVVLTGLVGFIIAWLEFSHFKFMLDDDSFKITRGVLTAEDIAIPYRRIEAVDIKEPIILQLFGVSKLIIETTIDEDEHSDNKSSFNDNVIPIVERRLALIIQDELTKRANTQKMNIQEVPA